MILKEYILDIPNSCIVAAMYATLATTEHSSLNPKAQADFDPDYLIKMLGHVLFVDTVEKSKEFAEEKIKLTATHQSKTFKDADEQNAHFENLENMFKLKNQRLTELAALQQNFYATLTDFAALLDGSGEVKIDLNTQSYYNNVSFDFDRVVVKDFTIYDEQFSRMLNNVKKQLRAAIEEQHNADNN